MKHVVSVSLGSSKRDHKTEQKFGNERVTIERIGTDGDKKRAISLIRELDGKVDAFGMGGTDLYLYAGCKRYTFRESIEIAKAAQKTPIVDGSGLKNTLERQIVDFLKEKGIDVTSKSVLVVCGVDRFGMAEAFANAGSKLVFGDIMFGLGLPLPIKSLQGLISLAHFVVPIITKLPISMVYPTGSNQCQHTPKYSQYFYDADIIAGDFHFIRKFMPDKLPGKIIITNTVTAEDQKLLVSRGVDTLVTTTPEMDGRSFGTNVLEAVLISLAGAKPENIKGKDYLHLLEKFSMKPMLKSLS